MAVCSALKVALPQFAKRVLLEGGAIRLHELELKMQIVQGSQRARQDLLGFMQMPQVGKREVLACIAGAVRINGLVCVAKASV